MARGEGATLEDVDGHRYINLLGEYTAGVFGHSHPVIRRAIIEAVEKGLNFGAHNVDEARLGGLGHHVGDGDEGRTRIGLDRGGMHLADPARADEGDFHVRLPGETVAGGGHRGHG